MPHLAFIHFPNNQFPTSNGRKFQNLFSTAEPPSTAKIDSAQSQEAVSNEAQSRHMNISFSIWPPTQRTHDAVINRLVESLSIPSILLKRKRTIPQDEASDIARQIEVEAFAVAGSTATDTDDGIKILQVYSKEISKCIIDTVKSRSAPAAGSVADAKRSESPADAKRSTLR